MLQGLAQACRSRISKGVSFLCLVPYCTVLRSRWYQSDINFILIVAGHHRPPAARFNLCKKEGQRFHRSDASMKLRSFGRYSVLPVVPSSMWTSSRLTTSSTVQMSSTIQAELRLLVCRWPFESVHRALGLRRDPTGYS